MLPIIRICAQFVSHRNLLLRQIFTYFLCVLYQISCRIHTYTVSAQFTGCSGTLYAVLRLTAMRTKRGQKKYSTSTCYEKNGQMITGLYIQPTLNRRLKLLHVCVCLFVCKKKKIIKFCCSPKPDLKSVAALSPAVSCLLCSCLQRLILYVLQTSLR